MFNVRNRPTAEGFLSYAWSLPILTSPGLFNRNWQPQTLYICYGLKPFRSIVSLLLTGLFLIPTAFESLHNWLHHEESHCTDTQSNHLHSVQHQCKLCDVFPTAVYSIPVKEQIKLYRITFTIRPMHVACVLPEIPCRSHFLRGPPQLA